MGRHWLALSAAAAALALLLQPACGDDSIVSDCGNDGKVTLVKGDKSAQAIVYGTACNASTLTVDTKGKLTASGLKLQVLQSIPSDVVELNLALNSLSTVPKLDADSLTKLTLTSNQFTSFKDINVPSQLKTLDLSWNSIKTFEGMTLPSTLTDLFVGGNKFTSLNGVFPNTLKLLYVHDLPLAASLSDATLPSSIGFLSLVNSGLTTLPSAKLPANLTSLDVSKNSLTALPVTFPKSLTTLIASSNKLPELVNVSFPVAMTTLNLSGNPITKVVGVSFPWSLTTLDLGAATITQIELSRTDYATLGRLKAFSASIKMTGGCSNGAEQVALGGSPVCVLTDDAFKALYRGAASPTDPSASTNGTATSSKESSSSLSAILIVVICVAAVLALALAVVGVRSYRARMVKQQQRQQQNFADTGFFANHTVIGSTSGNAYSGSRSATHANGSGSGGDLRSTNYSFNTIFTGGKVTMMGGAAVESSLIKYRIPSGDIKIGKAIAKGGFGIVHVANYHGDKVVVKKILPDKASDDRCLAAFLDEIKLCSTLRHAKVVGFIGVSWNTLSDMAVVLEFMPNGDLEQLLRRQAAAPAGDFDWYQSSAALPSKAALALDVMEAVVYLHSFSSPIIHRDLKSKNVLLGPSYEAKLSDFGVSREWQVDTTMTAGIGTMAWIAPEVLRGERYTEMADIYSLGVLLSELATCRKPFEGVTNALIVLKVTSEEKPELGPDCPEDVRELALRCLSFNASDRPSAMVAHYEMRTLLKLHTAFEL